MSIKNVITLAFILITALAYAQDIDSDKKLSYNKQFFIENKGQWPDEVLFMTKTNGMDAWITKTGVVYDFYQLIEKEKATELTLEKEQQTFKDKKGHIIKFNLLQCNKNIIPEGNYKQEAYYNYFIGNDKSKWASFVGLYNEVTIRNIYNGIDIRYYFDNSSLRYDYIVNPGADPKQIQFNMEGAEQISLNNAGEIVIKTTIGETKQTGLFSYQNLHNKKQAIHSFFSKLSKQTFAIALGTYDNSKPLIIDPLVFSTFLGGTQNEYTKDIALDNANNIVVMTATDGTSSFPVTPGSYKTIAGSTMGSFTPAISKLASNGSSLVFSTFLGGAGSYPYFLVSTGYGSVALDSIGNIYIAGDATGSLPITPGCFDPIRSGGSNTSPNYDGFIAKLNNTGSALLYATYFGGSVDDKITDIAVDRMGNAYVVGFGGSIPTTLGSFDTASSGGFLAKLNPLGTALAFCTSFKGTPYSVTVDSIGNAIVAGATSNSSFTTTTGSYDPSYNGGKDGFITKFNNTGNALIFSTFIGGSTDEYLLNLKVDSIGTIYLAGYTNSSNYPVTTNAYDNSWNGGTDMIFGKLNSTGTTLNYSSFIGTTGNEYANGIAFDNTGNIYLSGYTNSSNYPTTLGCFSRSYNGGVNDAVFTKLDNTGNQILYSSFLGGSYDDQAFPISIDNNKDIIIAGCTEMSRGLSISHPSIIQNNNFPVSINAFDTGFNKNGDVFITKFKDCIFALSAQPINKSITIGSSTLFSVNTSVIGAAFQWQQDNGNGFVNLSNAGPYTGATSGTLNINNPGFSFNNNKYRCIVSSGVCNIISDTALLTINCSFNISSQPINQSVNQGSNTQFSVVASSTTASYQWQQNTGTGFVNLVNTTVFSNVTDDTLIINATPITFNNTSFRCIVTDNACSVTSNAVNLTVNCTLAVSRQPIPVSILVNSNNQFSVATNTSGATFQWQQSLGTGFTNLSNSSTFSNVTDDTLLINNAPLLLNNTRFRCVINDGPCSKISDSILLNVSCSLTINTQPVNKNIPAESNTIMSVNASGFATTFQWQQNTGSGFVNLSNNSTFSNVDDDTLIINVAPKSLNNTTYRCIVNDGPCSLASSSAILNVYCVSSITRQVNNTNVIIGSNALFSVASANNNATFQWQQNDGTGFINIYNNAAFTGTNDDSLTIVATTIAQNNNTYRCLIYNESCIDTSSIGTLTISCPFNITGQPQNQTINNGGSAQFIVQVDSNVSYQWQQNTGTGFVNISDNSLFSGTKNDTLILNGASFLLNNNNTYRCWITLNNCYTYSIPALLNINCISSITLQPPNRTINQGDTTSFIVHSNNPAATFQWQINKGSGFTNISNDSIFNNANNDSLIINKVPSSMNNNLFRCIINNNNCFDTTNNVVLTVNCLLAITQQPVNKSGKVNESTFFCVASSVNSFVSFKWQVNYGSGFVTLQNNTTYSGVNQDTLKIKKIQPALNNYQYRTIVYTTNLCCCSDTSNAAILQVSNISINEISNTLFNIYPNPNNGHFLIDELPDNAFITITDLVGKTITQLKTNDTKVNIDLSNAADGMYLVKVESNNYSAIRKVNITK